MRFGPLFWAAAALAAPASTSPKSGLVGADLAVRTAALRLEDGGLAWAEVGLMRLHFRVDSGGEPLEFRGPNGTQCSMSDRSCHGHVLGLFRARCGRRVWLSLGILPFFSPPSSGKGVVPPAGVRLGRFEVLLPIDCTVCRGPCELCDWAYSQSVMKPDIGLPFAFLPALFATAAPSDDCFTAPSNRSLTLAFLISMSGTGTLQRHRVAPPDEKSFDECSISYEPTPRGAPGYGKLSIITNSRGKPLEASSVRVTRRRSLDTPEPGDECERVNPSNPEPYTREPPAWSVLQMEALGALSSTVRDPAMFTFQVYEPVSKLAPDLISEQVKGAISKPIASLVINGVVANVVESVPDMLTDRVAAETVDAVTEATVALIVEEINPVLGQGVGEALADTIVPAVVGNLSQRVTERVLMRAVHNMSVVAATGARAALSILLTKSLSHAVTASLVHALTQSPIQDYFCYYCIKNQEYCEYCSLSPQQLYYAMYYTGYYSTYYALVASSEAEARRGFETVTRRSEPYRDELLYGTHKGRAIRAKATR